MYESMIKAISFARNYAESGDLESFSFHSNAARNIASCISDDAYLVVSLAIHSIIDDIKTRAVNDNAGKRTKASEYGDIHTWVRLKSNLNYIEGRKLPSGRIPDFILKENGAEYPIECKLVFTNRSLNQLKTYMREMKVDKGYAVAAKLTTKLPTGITFIKVPT